MQVDDHISCAMSGLLADGQQLAKFMRSECLDSKWSFDTALSTERLVRTVANKSQRYTQAYGRRPYGVGLLVIGYDVSQFSIAHFVRTFLNTKLGIEFVIF